MSSQDRLSSIFKAIADGKRRALFDYLVAHGETNVRQLSEATGINRHSVMQHLAVLEAADLVESRRDGRRRLLRPKVDSLRWAHQTWWSERLDPEPPAASETEPPAASETETEAFEQTPQPSIAWILEPN
jgi:DNA-binding transcriptional ArsR family regulator